MTVASALASVASARTIRPETFTSRNVGNIVTSSSSARAAASAPVTAIASPGNRSSSSSASLPVPVTTASAASVPRAPKAGACSWHGAHPALKKPIDHDRPTMDLEDSPTFPVVVTENSGKRRFSNRSR